MSAQRRRISVPQIRSRKGEVPVVCLTAYTAPVAEVLDPHCDLMLVGDSMAMVLYGMESTLGITLDTMINHGRAVVRASKQACIVVDLPFGTYEAGPAEAFANAARVMAETGCQAVKLEGGVSMAETIRFLTRRGIPVLAHVGLMPQAVNTAGGFKARGKSEAEAEAIMADAQAVAEAGAFAVVIEGTMEPLARRITETIDIPTIGIGASAACDGQILVIDDMVGMFQGFTPRFVKRYAEIGTTIGKAAADYAEEVRARKFPGPEHCFGVPKAEGDA